MHDEMCTACEMAVVWMQNQLRRNQTEEKIMDYINEASDLHITAFRIQCMYGTILDRGVVNIIKMILGYISFLILFNTTNPPCQTCH